MLLPLVVSELLGLLELPGVALLPLLELPGEVAVLLLDPWVPELVELDPDWLGFCELSWLGELWPAVLLLLPD